MQKIKIQKNNAMYINVDRKNDIRFNKTNVTFQRINETKFNILLKLKKKNF